MTTHVALLRAVNVGGRGSLPMADLRRLVESLGHRDVRTYIQSGNVLFDAADQQSTPDAAGDERLGAGISAAIEQELGMRVAVAVRTPHELADALARHPFLDEPDHAKLMISFLVSRPDAAAGSRLEHERFSPERFALIGRDVHLHYPNGSGRSKLTSDYLERRLGVAGTVRNLKTVRKLVDLATGV